jgi:hypothetical protein
VRHPAFNRRCEHAPRLGDLILDERSHEEEGVDAFEQPWLDHGVFEIERDDIRDGGKYFFEGAGRARANPDLDPTPNEGASNLSTYRTARAGEKRTH